jgi:uncharacterized protein (TIGR02597 family)
LLNDVTAQGTNLASGSVYFYHDGSQGPAGWYQSGNLGDGLKNDVVVSPESYITLRNQTGSPIAAVMPGTVPTVTVSNDILQLASGDQDNQITNPFPAGLKLVDSELISDGVISPSPDPFLPDDFLLVFDSISTSQNPAADTVFFYHDGSQGPEGWYESGNLGAGLQNLYEIPSGGAIIIRKKGGTDAVVNWSPGQPYTL